MTAERQPGSPSSGPFPRTVALPGGRTITVRHSEPRDAAELTEFYERLSLDDRYHRFFSGARPKDFVERWTHLAERGGVGLVAVVANGTERIVADAGFDLLPDGDGELAITVERDWRGWLGAYLLDALVQEAAARGIPNLQAEILVDNGPMLALVRSRGYAILDHGDWTSVRVTIGTRDDTPDWPEGDERPRVLVETPSGRWPSTDAAVASGLRVMACPGPARGPHGCPALAGRPCPLAAHADVIVFAFPPSDADAQAILTAHSRLHEEVPLVVAPTSTAEELVVPPVATTIAACTPAAEVIALVSELAWRHRGDVDASVRRTDAEPRPTGHLG